MAQEVEVKVPDIGDYKDVPIIEVFVKPGDHVDKDASLVTLESEKATMDVPAPSSGVVKTMRLKVGDHVSEGDLVLVMELADSPQDAATRANASDASDTSAKAGKADPKPEPPATSSRETPKTDAASAPTPKAASSSAGQRIAVAVPDIGDYKDVPIIEVFVKDGDRVAKDAPLLTLESEKATMDVPAPADGVVREFKLKVGDTVSEGSAILTLETEGEAAAPDSTAKRQSKPEPESKTEAKSAPAGKEDSKDAGSPRAQEAHAGGGAHASPSVRKFARELGVDITQVRGNGPHQRITREDLQAFIKQRLAAPQAATTAAGSGIPPIPAVDFSKFGPVSTQPLGRIRKYSAAHLQRSWLNVPHVTQHDEADITELEAFRKTASQETGIKLTMLPFVMKAVAAALRKFPEFNSSLAPDGETLVLKQYAHIGFAADTEQGLVVPVVRDVWDKNIVTLARQCAELAGKARDGKLKPDEMRGGCFSISSLGGIGGSFFTPIVNAPEVAILGVSRSQTKPVWDGQAFAPRLIVPLSLSYDHRVIDGAAGARFIVFVVSLLADLRKLSLY